MVFIFWPQRKIYVSFLQFFLCIVRHVAAASRGGADDTASGKLGVAFLNGVWVDAKALRQLAQGGHLRPGRIDPQKDPALNAVHHLLVNRLCRQLINE